MQGIFVINNSRWLLYKQVNAQVLVDYLSETNESRNIYQIDITVISEISQPQNTQNSWC